MATERELLAEHKRICKGPTTTTAVVDGREIFRGYYCTSCRKNILDYSVFTELPAVEGAKRAGKGPRMKRTCL